MHVPEMHEYTLSLPGAGDVTNGSVDYYDMDWEITGGPGPLEEKGLMADSHPESAPRPAGSGTDPKE